MTANMMIKAASFTFKSKVGKMFGKDEEGMAGGFFSKSASQLPGMSGKSEESAADGKRGKRARGLKLSPTRVFQEEGRPEAPAENTTSPARKKLKSTQIDLDEEFFSPVSRWEMIMRGSQMLAAAASGYYKGFIPSLFYLVAVFSFIFAASLLWYHLLSPHQKEKSFGDIPLAFKRTFTATADTGLMVFWFAGATQAGLWCRACFTDLSIYLIPPAPRSGCNVFFATAFFGYTSALLFTITAVYTATSAHRSMREFCGYDRQMEGGDEGSGRSRGGRKNRRSLFTIPGREEDLTHKFSKRSNGGKSVAKVAGGAVGGVIPEEGGVGAGKALGVIGARASVTGGRPPSVGRGGANKSSSLVEIEIN
ncbi:hypothetical protein HDU67_008220 [Dinochytrium kinnereticum]|nr:hypothetical protein HDU67_008220 [Dinochytrium kinnereticum]